MTTLTPADIVSLDNRPLSVRHLRRRSNRGSALGPSRREFVHGALMAGAAVSVGALGWLPTARPAAADPPDSWQIWPQCSGLGSWVNDDDCNGCNQGSVICCCDGGGYHVGPSAGCNYAYRPNQCKDGTYDGWNWANSSCCYSSTGCPSGCLRCYTNRTWRCTDGYYRSSCSAGWSKSICRWLLSGGTPAPGCVC
jgi:hypothetical protein